MLVVWTFVCLFPIYWTLTTSFKLAPDVMKGHLAPWWDFTPRWKGWESLGISPRLIGEESTTRAEFLKRCSDQGLSRLEAHGVSYGKAVPFLPILELIRAYFGIGEHDSPESTRDKIAGRLLRMDEAFRESLPLIFDLVGVADPAAPKPAVDPQVRPERIHGVRSTRSPPALSASASPTRS